MDRPEGGSTPAGGQLVVTTSDPSRLDLTPSTPAPPASSLTSAASHTSAAPVDTRLQDRARAQWPRILGPLVTDVVIGVVLFAMLGRTAVLPVVLFTLATAATVYALLRPPAPARPRRARRAPRATRHSTPQSQPPHRHTWTRWSHEDIPDFPPILHSEDDDLGLAVTRVRYCRACRQLQSRDDPLYP